MRAARVQPPYEKTRALVRFPIADRMSGCRGTLPQSVTQPGGRRYNDPVPLRGSRHGTEVQSGPLITGTVGEGERGEIGS
jgi:hypothetical protein